MKLFKKSSEARRESMNITAVIILVVLSVYVISLFIPLVWAFITSFKQQTDFRVNIIGLPQEWVWNYSYIFKMFYVRVQSPTGLAKISMGAEEQRKQKCRSAEQTAEEELDVVSDHACAVLDLGNADDDEAYGKYESKEHRKIRQCLVQTAPAIDLFSLCRSRRKLFSHLLGDLDVLFCVLVFCHFCLLV